MDEIKLDDTFKIDDDHSHVRGIVCLYEGDKLIFKKENMIVKSGRQAIFDRLFNNKDFSISGFIIGTNKSLTTANSDINSFGEPYYIYSTPPTNTQDGTDAQDDITFEIDNNNSNNTVTRRYSITIPGTRIFSTFNTNSSNTPISCFGLLCDSGDEDDILFSRVVFPEYILKSSVDLTIKYTLYF